MLLSRALFEVKPAIDTVDRGPSAVERAVGLRAGVAARTRGLGVAACNVKDAGLEILAVVLEAHQRPSGPPRAHSRPPKNDRALLSNSY
jgi:hypothetical protein